MANDINRVILVGRLTRDPELKSTNSGAYFCKFSIASNRTIFKRDQDNEDVVGFFDCIAWGKTAEVICKYVQKGKRVGIDGSLRWSSWENAEGKKQSKVEVNVENFQFLEARGSDQNTMSQAPQGGGAVMGAMPESDFTESAPMSDDDIPF